MKTTKRRTMTMGNMNDDVLAAADAALVESMVRQLRDCVSVGDEMTLDHACLIDDAADHIDAEPARQAAAVAAARDMEAATFEPLVRERDLAQAQVEAARAGLNQIACWDEGPDVCGTFDEPCSAQAARDTLAAMDGAKPWALPRPSVAYITSSRATHSAAREHGADNMAISYRCSECGDVATQSSKSTYSMLDYDTAQVVGQGDAELARESAGSTPTGCVLAYLGSDGVLHYLPESREADYRRMGKTVVSVYLDPSVPVSSVL